MFFQGGQLGWTMFGRYAWMRVGDGCFLIVWRGAAPSLYRWDIRRGASYVVADLDTEREEPHAALLDGLLDALADPAPAAVTAWHRAWGAPFPPPAALFEPDDDSNGPTEAEVRESMASLGAGSSAADLYAHAFRRDFGAAPGAPGPTRPAMAVTLLDLAAMAWLCLAPDPFHVGMGDPPYAQGLVNIALDNVRDAGMTRGNFAAMQPVDRRAMLFDPWCMRVQMDQVRYRPALAGRGDFPPATRARRLRNADSGRPSTLAGFWTAGEFFATDSIYAACWLDLLEAMRLGARLGFCGACRRAFIAVDKRQGYCWEHAPAVGTAAGDDRKRAAYERQRLRDATAGRETPDFAAWAATYTPGRPGRKRAT